ncbi:methyltransferase type 11 [Geminocystis sp. NIES-3708]|uniref:hypothetical protein n=1 Tax=Geminocystis sp. NIES-3708 TaxID=1615909 RepID=UPI0005FC3DC3|nr:hypothetical protein [Geminocystis sp. NIES-3708]BAQ61443.1 methyltransferase type 11 [Geminocystis sp. NIES-3708]
MLEINIPNIGIKIIKNKIKAEINCIEKQKKLDSEEQLLWHNIEEQIKYFQGFINTAKSRSARRNNLPNSWTKKPFIFLLKPFTFIFFKILNFLFKDQREVNFNVLQALEESVKINQMLVQQIKIINKNTEEDLISLKFIDSDLKDKYEYLIEKINYLEEK